MYGSSKLNKDLGTHAKNLAWGDMRFLDWRLCAEPKCDLYDNDGSIVLIAKLETIFKCFNLN